MSVYYMRPRADDKAQWTEVPVGAAWSILNAEVTEADTPDTSTNYVEAPTSDAQLNRQFMTLPTIPSDERVVRLDAYWYMRAATNGQDIGVSILGVGSSTGNLPAGGAYQWVTFAIGAGFNISESYIPLGALANVQMQAVTTGVATNGTGRIAEEFVKLTTVSVWTPHGMPLG